MDKMPNMGLWVPYLWKKKIQTKIILDWCSFLAKQPHFGQKHSALEGSFKKMLPRPHPGDSGKAKIFKTLKRMI